LSAQTIFWGENKAYFTGQRAADIPELYIINTNTASIPTGTEFELHLPEGFNAQWQSTDANDQNKFNIRYNPSKKLAIIQLKSALPEGEWLKISNLKLYQFSSSEKSGRIMVISNGKKLKTDLVKIQNPDFFKEVLSKKSGFDKFRQKMKFALETYRSGLLTIIPVNLKMDYSPSIFIGSEKKIELPRITITCEPELFQRQGSFVIQFPENVTLSSKNAILEPRMSVAWHKKIFGRIQNKFGLVKVRGRNILEIQIPDGYSTEEPIVISGLTCTLTDQKNGMAATPIHLTHSAYVGNIISSGQTIQAGFIKTTLHKQAQINIVANTGTVPMPRLDIYFSHDKKPISPGQKLAIKLPIDYPISFERMVNGVQLSGDMAPYFSDKVLITSKMLLLDLKEAIPADKSLLTLSNIGVSVRIASDKLAAFREEENINRRSRNFKKDKLMVTIIDNEYELTNHAVISTINTSFIDLFLDSDQAFLLGDNPTKVNPISLEVESDYPVFRKDDVFYLVLPKKYKGIWDLTQHTVSLSGNAASKVSNKVDVSQNYVKFTILEAFNTDIRETVIISNLRLERFDGQCKEQRLELKLDLKDEAITVANKIWTIDVPEFNCSEDQIVFFGDQSTKSYKMWFNTRGLKNYFYPGKTIHLIIPQDLPLVFDRRVNTLDNDPIYLNKSYQFKSDKEIVFNVSKNIPPNTQVDLAGIHFGRASGLTALPDTLRLSVNQRKSLIKNERSLTITPQNDEFNRALYVCNLIRSNFQKGDIIELELWAEGGTSLYWSSEKQDISFPVSGDLVEILKFSEGRYPSSLYLRSLKDWDLDHFVALKGLKIRNRPDGQNGAAYIRIKYNNLYGPEIFTYEIPVNINKQLARKIPEQKALDSKTKAFIEFYQNSDNRILISPGGDEKELPIFKLNNGEAMAHHKTPFQEFRTYVNNIPNAIRQNRLDDAEMMADRLIQTGKNSWYGYYYKAKVLREKEENIAEAQANFAEAKSKGYIPSAVYPPVFKDNQDDQMVEDIMLAMEMINSGKLIEAERKLRVHEQMDSLSVNVIDQAAFWLAVISYKFQDMDYFIKYANVVQNEELFYTHPQTGIEMSLEDMYMELELLGEDDFYHTDLIINPPMGSPSGMKVLLELQNPDEIPIPIEIVNRSQKNQVLHNQHQQPIEVSEQEIYQIQSKPMRYHLKNFMVGSAGVGLLWIILLI
jgi:hypothetical protein